MPKKENTTKDEKETTATTKQRKSSPKHENIQQKLSEVAKKQQQQKAAAPKPKPTGFFGNFKETMWDDLKGTSIILAVFFTICLALKTWHPVSICVSGFDLAYAYSY